MQVDAELCGGNIFVVGHRNGTMEIGLRSDNAANILQWFHFRVHTRPFASVKLAITNAMTATFSGGFFDYQAFASYDLDHWFRVPTEMDGGRRLVIHHRPELSTTYYSYFAAYPLARIASLLGVVERSERARVIQIGWSVEGRPLPLVILGQERPGKRRVWIVARQHPGETMASWFVEGAITRLLGEDEASVDALLDEAVVYIMPNMNPDGSTRGNFRTNAAGKDLNREWLFPDARTSPEVLAVRNLMEETGVDLFLDVHGDEDAYTAFAIGCEGSVTYSDRIHALERRFAQSLAQRDGSFSSRYDYGANDPGKGDMSIGNNWVGMRFNCLSLTIEMPFKAVPQLGGFGPEHASQLGRSSMDVVLESLGVLR